MADWFTNEQFWRDTARFMFGPTRMESTPGEVDRIVELCALRPGSRVLDMPCGPGRHSMELARRGMTVMGVDLTELYVERARATAADAGLDIEFHQADMRGFRAERLCDAVINMFTSFGYFRDADDDRRVAGNFFASLRPGGRLLMEMMSKEVLARIFEPRRFDREEDGTIFLQETEVLEDWSWVRSTWTAFMNEGRFQHTIEHRIYSAVELRALLESVGFEDVTCFGDLEGAPYDDQAKRLIIRAKKPAS
ncbi:MAG: class I SAM-dependent methyltransferase [Phycisphaerales bacterium]|nr:class I SAM-dependent methyltransferase [Phycisphaerales bacterium]